MQRLFTFCHSVLCCLQTLPLVCIVHLPDFPTSGIATIGCQKQEVVTVFNITVQCSVAESTCYVSGQQGKTEFNAQMRKAPAFAEDSCEHRGLLMEWAFMRESYLKISNKDNATKE
jgi:enamine deaminase RidA (YjgF/YER057c/UK114 family)